MASTNDNTNTSPPPPQQQQKQEEEKEKTSPTPADHQKLIAETIKAVIATEPSGSEAEQEAADRTNAAVLHLRGYTSTATGKELWGLAKMLELNVALPVQLTPTPTSTSTSTSTQSSSVGAVNTFTPPCFFFYGSLQDPDCLSAVCSLLHRDGDGDSDVVDPVLEPASITGWRVKMWGHFPALVPAGAGDVVKGLCWQSSSGQNVVDLCRYESRAYRLQQVTITKEDGTVIEDGRTFVSNETPEELEEGAFDLQGFMNTNMSMSCPQS